MRRLRQQGITVIECILATFIVVSGFLAVASIFPASYHEAVLDQNHSLALGVAKNIIENISATYPNAPGATFSQGAKVTVNTTTEGLPSSVTYTIKSLTFAATNATTPSSQFTNDVVTVVLEWEERDTSGGAGTGQNQTHTKTFSLSGGVGNL